MKVFEELASSPYKEGRVERKISCEGEVEGKYGEILDLLTQYQGGDETVRRELCEKVQRLR